MCDHEIQIQALEILSNHTDDTLGAVTPGSIQDVGFQYLKTPDALMAAQALAHVDFHKAAAQFRNVMKHQRSDGFLAHVVYGPSVNSSLEWIDSDRTYLPGPAFWNAENEYNSSRLSTSDILTPPIVADVAWEMFRLSPYETGIDVVHHTDEAVDFLCEAYPSLSRFQDYLWTRRQSNATSNDTSTLLYTSHPWETFSSLSSHWKQPLGELKRKEDYASVIRRIPKSAKDRFAIGASPFLPAQVAVKDVYEPMIYLAYNRSTLEPSEHGFGVQDVEFNSLALRSAEALSTIARVVFANLHSCSNLDMSKDEMAVHVKQLDKVVHHLKRGIFGSSNTTGLWNPHTQFFDDTPNETDESTSLRGFLPAYAAKLSSESRSSIMSHFLAPSETFHFFCTHFPVPFNSCSPPTDSPAVSILVYNYFTQRGFIHNDFPGVGEFIRNSTRDMVCTSSVPRMTEVMTLAKETPSFSPAFYTQNGSPISYVEDSFVGSTLAASALVNILLPAVTPPPSPDAPPIDHRMLTAVMCVELVVAFGVAIGCFLFSVYFVANRPKARRRSLRGKSFVTGEDSIRRLSATKGEKSVSSEQGARGELEEALLPSEEEDVDYGSFDESSSEDGSQRDQGNWTMLQEGLSAISPW